MKDVLKYSLGLDVSSKDFQACVSVMTEGQRVVVKGSRKFTNDAAGFLAFDDWKVRHLKLDLPVVYVMEATGVYHENLCDWLYDSGCKVSVIVPTMGKRYAQSLGTHTKNDVVDAKVLAQLGAERQLELWQPFCPEMRKLRKFTRQHENLQTLKTQVENQLQAHQVSRDAVEMVEKQLDTLISTISTQIKELEKEIGNVIMKSEKLAQKWQHIQPIYGIGLLSFAVIIAETNGFQLFRNERQLVKYAGYDVIENQSGKHTGRTKISKKGNSHIRRILYMPAFVAVGKEDSVFAKLYNRIFDRTKIKMKAYVAVQRKLLTIIFHLWKKEEKFDNHYRPQTLGNIEPIASLFVPNG